jgi:hypothetical protein
MQRTLAALREAGYLADKAEQWIQYAPQDSRRKIRPGERKDLFGWIDVIGLAPGKILAVQVCGSDVAAHIRKIEVERGGAFRAWIGAGGAAEVWGWRKVKAKRGGKAMVWKPRVMTWLSYFNRWEEG